MPAKIVHLIGQMVRGGAERQLLHLAEGLHRRGWPQAVVSFRLGGAWRDRWEKVGVPVYEVPQCAFSPWRLWQLSRILRRERPKVIQTWSWYLADYVRWAWGKNGAPTVFGLREDVTLDRDTGEPMERLLCQRGLEAADFAISNSRLVFPNLERYRIRIPPHTVIGNIVVPLARANAGESVAIPRIVAIGALQPMKAYDVLLDAVGRLAAEGKRFELHIAGEGPERGRLEAMVSSLSLGGCVRLLGEVDDVPQLLAAAHILVHPSKREGLSNTVLEGMAAGLPVVGMRETAAEIIENERTGLLTPAGEPAQLAEALRRLLGDSSLRERLGAAAYEHVGQCYSSEVICKQYEQVYESLLNGTGIRNN